MKKVALIFFLFLVSIPLMASAVWDPSFSAAAGYKADGLQKYLSNSLYFEIGIDPLAVRIDERHSLSLPFSVTYSGEGNEHLYERKQDELIFTLQALYSFRLSELLSLGAGAGVRTSWHLGSRYLSAAAGASLRASFHMTESVSIIVPLSFYASRNDWSLSLGAGVSVRFMEAI